MAMNEKIVIKTQEGTIVRTITYDRYMSGHAMMDEIKWYKREYADTNMIVDWV